MIYFNELNISKIFSFKLIINRKSIEVCLHMFVLSLQKPSVYFTLMKVKVHQSCPTLCNFMDYTVHGILQARILEWVAGSLLQGIFPTQELNPGLPHCRQILNQLSHKGSPRILEWAAYPSLLQWIFPTQESNRGLLHCRQILYQLSYEGKPKRYPGMANFTPLQHLDLKV